MRDNLVLDVLVLLSVLFILMFIVQYFVIIKPAKKRLDIWLQQRSDKINKKGS